MKIKVSYIIITWNGLPLLKQLLGSLQKQMLREDVDVWVADNGSQDGTVDFIRGHYPAVHLMELSENKGVAFARNRLLEQAKGEYLFILDNDIMSSDETVEGMEKYMDAHPEIGLSACQLVGKDGEPQENCKPFPGIWQKICSLVLHRTNSRFHYENEMKSGQPFEPVYVIGACQLIRRSTFQQVGLLDERIFYGPEDCDYCLRVRNAGWKVAYLPQFTLQHLCQRKTFKRPFSSLGLKHILALLYFYWKYKRC